MSQITSGVRAILSSPHVYELFQSLMGAKKGRETFARDYIKAEPDMKVLDIGCGTAAILEHLPAVNYWGFDGSQAYIDMAKKKYGARGKFFCRQVEEQALENLPKFDRILAVGILHHLDDASAHALIKLAFDTLTPGGSLITIDACYASRQNPIARFLISLDRGQNVRDQAGYENLVKHSFVSADIFVQHKKWPPYTHCITKSTR
jgi:cyclopropane fatty-acyl-phospholipid synthase-like methyltransferase